MPYALFAFMCQTPKDGASELYEIRAEGKSFEAGIRIRHDNLSMMRETGTYKSAPERIPPSNPIVIFRFTASTMAGSASSDPIAPSI